MKFDIRGFRMNLGRMKSLLYVVCPALGVACSILLMIAYPQSAIYLLMGGSMAIVAGIFVRAWLMKRRNRFIQSEVQGGAASGGIENRQGIKKELRQKLNEVLSEVRAGGQKNYFYEAPWYMMVGEPQSGKTKMIVNSGLHFPFGAREKVKGIKGTHGCEWFFTKEAVLLDTEGQFWVNEKEEEKGFNAFIDFLRGVRPKCPINGVIVTIPTTALYESKLERERKAIIIRQKLNNLALRLKIRFPVYVMITKCDRIIGFSEFFSLLQKDSAFVDETHESKDDRQQIFGWSNPHSPVLEVEYGHNDQELQDRGYHRKILYKGYADLYRRLERLRLIFLAQESDAHKRDQIFQFPEEFHRLSGAVLEYVTGLLPVSSPAIGIDPLFFRGLYFSSAEKKHPPFAQEMRMIFSRHFPSIAQQIDERRHEEESRDEGEDHLFDTDTRSETVIPRDNMDNLEDFSEANPLDELTREDAGDPMEKYENLSTDSEESVDEGASDSNAYFLDDFFLKKIFKERGLTAPIQGVLKTIRNRQLQMGFASAAVVVIFLVYFAFRISQFEDTSKIISNNRKTHAEYNSRCFSDALEKLYVYMESVNDLCCKKESVFDPFFIVKISANRIKSKLVQDMSNRLDRLLGELRTGFTSIEEIDQFTLNLQDGEAMKLLMIYALAFGTDWFKLDENDGTLSIAKIMTNQSDESIQRLMRCITIMNNVSDDETQRNKHEAEEISGIMEALICRVANDRGLYKYTSRRKAIKGLINTVTELKNIIRNELTGESLSEQTVSSISDDLEYWREMDGKDSSDVITDFKNYRGVFADNIKDKPSLVNAGEKGERIWNSIELILNNELAAVEALLYDGNFKDEFTDLMKKINSESVPKEAALLLLDVRKFISELPSELIFNEDDFEALMEKIDQLKQSKEISDLILTKLEEKRESDGQICLTWDLLIEAVNSSVDELVKSEALIARDKYVHLLMKPNEMLSNKDEVRVKSIKNNKVVAPSWILGDVAVDIAKTGDIIRSLMKEDAEAGLSKAFNNYMKTRKDEIINTVIKVSRISIEEFKGIYVTRDSNISECGKLFKDSMLELQRLIMVNSVELEKGFLKTYKDRLNHVDVIPEFTEELELDVQASLKKLLDQEFIGCLYENSADRLTDLIKLYRSGLNELGLSKYSNNNSTMIKALIDNKNDLLEVVRLQLVLIFKQRMTDIVEEFSDYHEYYPFINTANEGKVLGLRDFKRLLGPNSNIRNLYREFKEVVGDCSDWNDEECEIFEKNDSWLENTFKRAIQASLYFYGDKQEPSLKFESVTWSSAKWKGGLGKSNLVGKPIGCGIKKLKFMNLTANSIFEEIKFSDNDMRMEESNISIVIELENNANISKGNNQSLDRCNHNVRRGAWGLYSMIDQYGERNGDDATVIISIDVKHGNNKGVVDFNISLKGCSDFDIPDLSQCYEDLMNIKREKENDEVVAVDE